MQADARPGRALRWPWRAFGGAVALALLLDGDWALALAAVVAFAVSEVVFDAAEG